MKKVIRMENLDCAHCAQKMEDAVRKIQGVNEVSINFMLQKMTLDADDSCFQQVLTEVKHVCKQVEPDCTLKI